MDSLNRINLMLWKPYWISHFTTDWKSPNTKLSSAKDLYPGITLEVGKEGSRDTTAVIKGHNLHLGEVRIRPISGTREYHLFIGQRQTELFFFHIQVFCQLKTLQFVITFRCSCSCLLSTPLIPPFLRLCCNLWSFWHHQLYFLPD